MSRIGKQLIKIPESVTIDFKDNVIKIKGPKGELERRIHPLIKVDIHKGEITLSPLERTKQAKALWGTLRSHIFNMIHGVTEGYVKKLIVEGVGYKANIEGDFLVMQLGFSHPVKLKVPENIDMKVDKNSIIVSGIDKELVGQTAAVIRLKRKPEPYKGKGIRYEDEHVRRKAGKKAVAAGAS